MNRRRFLALAAVAPAAVPAIALAASAPPAPPPLPRLQDGDQLTAEYFNALADRAEGVSRLEAYDRAAGRGGFTPRTAPSRLDAYRAGLASSAKVTDLQVTIDVDTRAATAALEQLEAKLALVRGGFDELGTAAARPGARLLPPSIAGQARSWSFTPSELEEHPRQRAAPRPDPWVAGALYDFLGYLTTRPEPIEMGSDRLVYPALEALKDWADRRGLDLHDADVQHWHDSRPPPPDLPPGPEHPPRPPPGRRWS